MKKIFFFSENLNKINEIKILFKKTKIELLDLKHFYNINIPEETGKTFEDNARIKSYCGFKNSNYPCFADDSGLCISSLNDFPGIKSKRFIEKNKDIQKALASIISKTKKTGSSEAYFQTSICLTLEENHENKSLCNSYNDSLRKTNDLLQRLLAVPKFKSI